MKDDLTVRGVREHTIDHDEVEVEVYDNGFSQALGGGSSVFHTK